MAMPIQTEDVRRVLQPWLGAVFLQNTPLCQEMTDCLAGYAPFRQTLEELHTELEKLLLVRLNRYTGGTLTVITDSFRSVRITQAMLSAMTDDLMGIVFEKMTPFSANYLKLNDYSMKVQSLNALRVLYLKYESFYTEEERAFLVQMLKSIYPPECYRAWLKEEDR